MKNADNAYTHNFMDWKWRVSLMLLLLNTYFQTRCKVNTRYTVVNSRKTTWITPKLGLTATFTPATSKGNKKWSIIFLKEALFNSRFSKNKKRPTNLKNGKIKFSWKGLKNSPQSQKPPVHAKNVEGQRQQLWSRKKYSAFYLFCGWPKR